ncbi:MAG TPA: ATP-binding cassette domain-containing protein [Vitreimonas sp.]|uniref:ABC transporter ATP-binding protein n=1 Tax=Vitreimonas sp. TaxID=3069702 RepID=UPI002D520B68|nr:ATP-binding cassette domain-containing protein [Vitreimonas sp.]HYD88847.1 ATP-binding cassette domain-containing protein [Vitreimonas sp.]
MNAALEAEGLVKRYGARTAVQDLSFSVPQGSIYGVLGPNGAGKSTTLRMLVGVLRPTEGRISMMGGPVTRDALKRVGYLPEERGLYRSMSARGAIAYLARLKGAPSGKAFKRADQLLNEHGLGKVKRKKIKTLSKGMAQKVQVLGAIAHEPDIVIFDEPFSGLDPVNQRVLEDTIRAQAAAGRTILFSTHVMEHAERLCDRILLIAHGSKAFEGTVQEALALAPSVAVLETEGQFDLAAALAPKGFNIAAEGEEHGNRRWRAKLENGHGSRQLLQACVEAGAPLSLFEPARASLHEAFVAMVGDRAMPDAAE